MNVQRIKRCPALYKVLLAVRQAAGRAWMRAVYRVRGVDAGKVFFSSFKGKSYCDSPRFISEALHALRPDLKIVWQLAPGQDAPDYVRAVRPHSLSALSELATAGCIVDNFNRPIYLLKFPGQLYVQTWHGDRGFKKVLYDLPNPIAYPDGRQMDLAVAGSDFGEGVYRTAFRYSGEVLKIGMPRNDRLARPDPAGIAAIRRRLGIGEGVRVMLYAPTFRDATSGQEQAAGFDLERAVGILKQSTGCDWLCLTRAHDMNRGIAARGADIRDATGYPEMSDLLLASDLLVTDYSSSAGDFPLLGRPVILYQPDLDEFTRSDRTMYFDIRQSPFLRAESQDALFELLRNFDRLPDRSQEILAFYGAREGGDSAAAVARWISERLT